MELQETQNLGSYAGFDLGEAPVGIVIPKNRSKQEAVKEHLFSECLSESLPVQATTNDTRELVRVLRNKAAGLSINELLGSEPRRVFEPRKIDAYEYWGIIRREGERVKLTDLGIRLSEIVASENEIFEMVLWSVPIYVDIIKWINNEELSLVTHLDVNEFLSRLDPQRHLEVSEAETVSFFSLCHGAELGVATVGKRGKPARLKTDIDRIGHFLSLESRKRSRSMGSHHMPVVRSSAGFEPSVDPRIYISNAPSIEIREHLSGALELADLESVVTKDVDKDDHLQSEKLQAMQVCQAGVIFINDEDCSLELDENTKVDDTRLAEITAATGLFNWRLVIVWNCSYPVPEYLRRLNIEILPDNSGDLRVTFQLAKIVKKMICNAKTNNN